MAFVVIYDACVLYPGALRDFLVRAAQTEGMQPPLVQAKWTERILDECFENILENEPWQSREKLGRTRQLMTCAVRDCLVTGYEPLIQGLSLPDPNDRHVLAAAIRAGAQTIVTRNLKDFPDEALEQFDVLAQDPDDFALGLLELNEQRVHQILRQQRTELTRSPKSPTEFLEHLEDKVGLRQFVAELRRSGWA